MVHAQSTNTFDSISQPIEVPVEKVTRNYLSRGQRGGRERTHYKADLYSRNETRSITEPHHLGPQRSTLSRPLSPDAFYCFSSREDCPGPCLELGGTIFTIHAFRRGPFFLYLSFSASLSHTHTHTYTYIYARVH